ncbi:hypothetical protein R1flu_010090 [Riccia fluitans]|uniref:Uncharacterized protein n=1 Tax=Riccia fluitans TaxID=41844 RepID=A0ABD1Z446_9MARC
MFMKEERFLCIHSWFPRNAGPLSDHRAAQVELRSSRREHLEMFDRHHKRPSACTSLEKYQLDLSHVESLD